MPSPEDCRIVTTCSSNSQCFVEQVVTSGGVILYNSGCLSTSRCEHNGRKRQETVSGSDIVTCVSCCQDDFCNLGGCGVVAARQPQRPPVCFSCPRQVEPSSCRDVTLCDVDHMCVLIETQTYNSHQWKSECAPKLQCQILGNRSVAVGSDLCYMCCQDDFCNNNCNQQITKTTVLTPTKFTTSTLSAIVSNSNPPMQIASTVNIVNKLTTVPHSSTQNLTATSTQTTNSQITSEVIPSATAAHTKPSSILSRTPTLTLNNTSTSPKPLSESTGSTFSGISTGRVSLKPTTAILRPLNATSTPHITGKCTNRTYDICFVIDSSGSLGQSGFDKELHFVNEVVRNIAKETNSTTHFCVVRFSTDAVLAVKLRKFHSVDSIIDSIGTIPYSTGETYTHVGLQKAVHELRHNGRLGVEKVIILVTDGKSNFPDKTLHVVHHMESIGIGLYAVGIGSHTNSNELQTIVTDKNHLLEVPDADHLHNSYVNIVQALCGGTSL